jgi:putative transposase
MAIPSRNASPNAIQKDERVFFVTSRTAQGKLLLQSERMATLFIDVLHAYAEAGEFVVNAFVVMPSHFHLLLSLPKEVTVEKAIQLIKGNFSFRARREIGIKGEIWQRGFSDERVRDRESFANHRIYIEQNPVRAGLVDSPEEYPYSSAFLRAQETAAAKAANL